jgi:hypothetical protein
MVYFLFFLTITGSGMEFTEKLNEQKGIKKVKKTIYRGVRLSAGYSKQ